MHLRSCEKMRKTYFACGVVGFSKRNVESLNKFYIMWNISPTLGNLSSLKAKCVKSPIRCHFFFKYIYLAEMSLRMTANNDQ